ncbi:MAG: patatin-like phospholipase family protein [Bdellovibrionales bacterium]|nr:patatin-like phospholipase family protein [Bdellovibrionales bacterium]
MRLSDKKSLSLVLSGGGVKAAAFHVGVCIALREKGFKFAGGSPEHVSNVFADDTLTFKTYVGSSAGSVVSTFLAAGYDIDAIVEAFMKGAGHSVSAVRNKRRDPSPTYLRPLTYRDIFALNIKAGHPNRIFSSLLKKKPVISGGMEVLLKRGFKVNGVFSTENLERYFRENAHPKNSFSSLGVKLFIVASQLNHSRKVVFGDFPDQIKDTDIQYANFATVSQAVAASAALPPFFAPYCIHDDRGRDIYYFDGEIRDSLSTHVAADNGSDLVIASYSIQPYHHNKAIGSLHEFGMPIIFNQALYQVVQQKIERHIKYQKNINQLISAVDGYLKQTDISAEHREKLIEIMITRTKHNPNVDYIYIHPSPQDHEMFFADHFSLNPDILGNIVKTGFKSAMHALRKHTI